MPRALRACPTIGCPQLTAGGRCTECRRTAERARGSATERGYTSKGHRRFRRRVLDRDPVCVLCQLAPSTVADHYPISRRDLIASGANPNDPNAGRGLCGRCHSVETARLQPGGWHA